MFITFIYKIGNNKKTYYGKYVCDYISDDHEGLDDEIESTVIDGINLYRKQKGLQKLKKQIYIGILSFSSNKYIPTYSTNKEIKCFDFYHKYFNHNSETYINGKNI
jgi:hypothetical protein